MKEEVYYVVDSLGISHQEIIGRQTMDVSRLFVEGGWPYMVIISMLLIALLIAAWKAPRWVKGTGIVALVISVFFTLLGLYQLFDTVQAFPGPVSFPVICGGLKCTMITLFYGLIVYFISLVIRIIQKPRI